MIFNKSEYERWILQAKYTIKATENDLKGGFYSWACFKAQQSAEFALKGLLHGIGESALGHSLLKLTEQINDCDIEVSGIEGFSRKLDKFYIPTRYPDTHPAGIPKEYYTREDANTAISYAKKIVKFVEEVANGLEKD